MAPKNDNFSHFAKHRLIKKTFCCNPPLDQKWVFFNLGFLKPRSLMLSKTHNLKSGKTKIRKSCLESKSKKKKKQKRVK